MRGKNRLFDPEDREALAEYKRQVGARITAMRKEKGMTQEMLAEEVGMNPKMISRVEVGTGNCRTWEIIGIAGALDASVDYLLRGEGREYRYVAIRELLERLNDDQLIRSRILIQAAFMDLPSAS